jgi:hypothetical protein
MTTVVESVRRRMGDLAMMAIAVAGLWFFWSQYSYLSALSWWYDNTQHLAERTAGRSPDYELASLPWTVARARHFDLNPEGMTIDTGSEPFAYQAFATIETGGARALDLQFAADVQSGGATIGVMQGGKWIATNSSPQSGPFAEGNSAPLTRGRSVTIVIANNNPAGESRLAVKSLRVFLRK